MSKPIQFLNFLWSHRSLWATVCLIAIVGFFDENSFLNLYRQKSENAKLRADIEKYEEDYELNTERLQQLSSSPKAIEEVARVSLMMKSEDEDVYLVE